MSVRNHLGNKDGWRTRKHNDDVRQIIRRELLSQPLPKRHITDGTQLPFGGKPYNPTQETKTMDTPTHALTVLNPEQAISQVKSLYAIVSDLYKNMLKKDLDYGVIPGTGTKPTLLLPGMEKLMRALNAVPRYIEKRVITDYDIDKPLFHYEYECQLIDADTGQFIPGGIGIGLCTSMESAFRWRKAERTCPDCGQATIIKGRAEYGGGWLCFAKKGGCGAKFADNDTRITDQEVGRVANPDIFDQVNAICKRAQKRALASAVKGAAAVSEFFTVDLEDFIDAEFTPTVSEAPTPTEKKADAPAKPKKANGDKPTPFKAGNKRGELHGVIAQSGIYDNAEHRIASINKMFDDGELKDDMELNAMIAVVLSHRAEKDLSLTADDIKTRLGGQTIKMYLDDGGSAESAWALLNELDDVKF